jgi:hypothetical protein
VRLVEKRIAELRRSNNILLTRLAHGSRDERCIVGFDPERERLRERERERERERGGREREGEMEPLKERRSSVASVGSTHDEGGVGEGSVGEGSVGGGSPMLVYRREREGGRDGAT